MDQNIVKRYRRLRGYSQAALGKMVGMSSAAVSQWERGETAEPDRDHVIAVDAALDADGDILAAYGFTQPEDESTAAQLREVLAQFAGLQADVVALTRRLDQISRRVDRLDR